MPPRRRSWPLAATALMFCQQTSSAAAACASHANCCFNGECQCSGVGAVGSRACECHCYPQWKGRHCEQLNLLPTARNLGYQPVMDSSVPPGFRNATTWGGQAIRHDDGVYHMWAAQMTENCGIWAWMQNSIVYHATSTSPYGPYQPVGPAISQPEAHEPIVARAPGGEYVMWFTSGADGPGTGSPVAGGRPCNCSTAAGIQSCEWQKHTGTFPTYMSWTRDPDGPWSTPRKMLLSPALGRSDSNFAGLIEADGSVLAVGREHLYRCRHWNDTASCTATLVPHSGNGAIRTASNTRGGMVGEDPFLFRDPRNANLTSASVLHMLRHVGRNTHDWRGNNGGHQYSTDDGRSWSDCVDGCQTAYPGVANFSDGSALLTMMRERPHLVYSADGHTILALTNGAAPGPCTQGTAHPGNDYAYTLLQRVNQVAIAEGQPHRH